MKRAINIMIGLAAMICAATACQKDEEVKDFVNPKLVGEWQLMDMKVEGNIINTGYDVYLCINSDCTFELYQKSGTQSVRYDKFTGTCTSDENILTGVYADGNPWGSKWLYSIIVDGMILTSSNNLEVQNYKKCSIPADVRKDANDVFSKSDVYTGTPIL